MTEDKTAYRGEWSFFLDKNGQNSYHRKCMSCRYPCKQSFRVELYCPKYRKEVVKRNETEA